MSFAQLATIQHWPWALGVGDEFAGYRRWLYCAAWYRKMSLSQGNKQVSLNKTTTTSCCCLKNKTLGKKQLCYKSVQAKNHCAKTSLIPFLVYCHQRSFDYPQSIGCGKFAKCSTCPITLTSKQMEELNRLAVVILQTPSTGTILYSNLKANKRR